MCGWRAFQPQASNPDLSTPDFWTMNFPTSDFSTNFWTMGLESSGLKSLGLKSLELKCPLSNSLTLFLPDLVTWCSYKGWFCPWPVGIGLKDISTPEFSALKRLGLEISWLKSLGLKGLGLKLRVEKSRVIYNDFGKITLTFVSFFGMFYFIVISIFNAPSIFGIYF